MNRLVTAMVLWVIGILLVFPHAAALAQCNMRQDPTPVINPGPPGQRQCCSLGAQTGEDPTNLTGHRYGNIVGQPAQTISNLPGGEHLGYIYTSRAGLVDLGHVRDNADMVFYVYIQLLNGQHRVYTSGGDVAGVPVIPKAKDDMLGLAGAIVFVNSWAHELTTWGGDTNIFLDSKAEDFSAFSPEDMSSNIVGIYVAKRAITNMSGGIGTPGPELVKQFDTEMDALLPMIIASLGPQSADETTKLLTEVVKFTPGGGSVDLTGKWWMTDYNGRQAARNTAVRLLRRNFDGAPWKITDTTEAPPPLETPAWLNTTRFSSFYPQFLYLVLDNPEKPMQKSDVDATLVPATNAYALASGFTPLAWIPTPAQERLIRDAVPRAGATDPLCIATPMGEPITSGQFTSVKVNVNPPPPLDVFWSFTHATQFLQQAFTAVNPHMDGPYVYVAPDIPRPQK